MSQRAPEAIPHAFPFRLVERAERVGDKRIGLVLATANGTLARGETWPCTLVAEAVAQALLVTAPTPSGAPRLVGIDKARMLCPLKAGDRLEVEADEIGAFAGLRRFRCRALAAGALAATIEVTVAG